MSEKATFINPVSGYSTMSRRIVIFTLLSVIGFVVLIAGALGYMKVYSLPESTCTVMIGMGIVAVIGSMIAVNIIVGMEGRTSEDENMGIVDKIKGLFKKKQDAPQAMNVSVGSAAAASAPAAPVSRAGEFKGEGKIYDALRYGAAKIDDKVAAGKIDDKRASMFMAQLKACEAETTPDDVKMIGIGQVIGAISSA